MITDGQKFSKPLLYDPLPPAVQELGKQGLARITFNGETVWNCGSAKQTGIEPIKSDAADKKTEQKKTELKKTEPKKTEKKKTELKPKTTTKPTTVKPTTSSK